MATQRYRVEIDRVVGHVAFIIEVAGPSRDDAGRLVPGETSDEAVAKVLAHLKAEPLKAKRHFDEHAVSADGAQVVEYVVNRVTLVDPPLVVGGPHRLAPDLDSSPSRESL